jgi:hypothetical protein
MKKIPFYEYFFAALFFTVFFVKSHEAKAVNITINKGWPCNIFVKHLGAGDAAGNSADFNVKATPASPSVNYGFIAGENADYLAGLPMPVNGARVENLPFLEPLNFNLQSGNFGANLGVDVCIPAVDAARDDVIYWTVSAYGLGALMPPAQGDWFAQSNPKISMTLLATNCNDSAASTLSTGNPSKAGFCEITSTPIIGQDVLSVGGLPVEFGFKLMASRQAVLRFTVEEQANTRRPWRLDAGTVQIDLVDPPLPPLLIGDLLDKQLFFIPDNLWPGYSPNLDGEWAGCENFFNKTGMAFQAMDLQGPANRLDLKWKGKDVDCGGNGCPDGNKDTKGGFTSPVAVYLEDGSLANDSTPTTSKVKNFLGLYNDAVQSNEDSLAYPSDGKIIFDANTDQVYRSASKTFFSTTVSRLIGPATWRHCRVWFKRAASFDCNTLPTDKLRWLCENALSNGNN